MNNSDKSHEQHADGIVEAGHKTPVYFYLLFFGLIAWGIIFMGYYLFSGWSSGAEFKEKMVTHTTNYSSAATPPKTVSAVQPATTGNIDAAALFAANCSGCHGEDGKGGFGSDLTSSDYEYGKDAASVRLSITKGRGGKMPAFGDQLSSAEISALADYIINL